MYFMFNFIQGVMAGFEFVDDPDEDISWLVVDLFIFRIMIGK